MGFIVHWSLILELSDAKCGSIAVGRLIVNLKEIRKIIFQIGK
jgi:hypothetical protein